MSFQKRQSVSSNYLGFLCNNVFIDGFLYGSDATLWEGSKVGSEMEDSEIETLYGRKISISFDK